MVDVFLIVVLIIMMVLVLASTAILVVKFGHPDDKNEARFPKIVTILGLFLAFGSALLLPYDVANSRGIGGGVDVGILWQIVYIVLAVMIIGLIPFAFFFYENDVDNSEKEERPNCTDTQTGAAMAYTMAFAIVLVLLMVIIYAFVHDAIIPVERIVQAESLVYSLGSNNLGTGGCDRETCVVGNFDWTIPVTFPVFMMAFLSFLGWFFFTLFVGVGFTALPIDLINEYVTRPKRMTSKEYFEQKRKLGNSAKALIVIGEKLKDQQDRGLERTKAQKKLDKKRMRKFEQNYYCLKRDYHILDTAHRLKGGNPLWYMLKLALGLLSVVLSLTWILHIILFILPSVPTHDFLNDLFIWLEGAFGGGFPLFGICAFAIYSYYLLCCCVKGNFKLGVRFLFWRLYPMEVGNTMMNSFLVNTWIILLCSVPTVQFCTTAFPIYARHTDIDMLFGTQIQNLDPFRILWINDIFIIVMLAFTVLTAMYLVVYPVDKAAKIDQELEKLGKAEASEFV